MIDFTKLPHKQKCYAGANGSKLSVIYNGEQYMLKFPPIPSRNMDMSYTNGCASEYIGCHIFEIIGIPVQETVLGTYTVGNKEKVVVACKDFTSLYVTLQDFASLKNTIIDSEHNGYGTELDDICRAMDEQKAIDPTVLREWFWDTFIVDALIGNWDRHNGNWGFLYNAQTDTMTIAPIYDCGSCLFPQADETIMQATLDDKAERDFRIFKIPLSGIKINNQKINYFDFISSLENDDCNAALRRIVPKIDISKICDMIDATPYISDLQKKFYKTMLSERKEKILDHSLNLLLQKERGCPVKKSGIRQKLDDIKNQRSSSGRSTKIKDDRDER